MTQNVVDFSDNPTGAGLMDDYLDKDQQNVLTSNSGIQRPSYAVAGTKWLDTSATPWVLKMYDGTDDVALGTVNPTTHAFVPYGVDSKQDIANLSQTLDTSTTKYPSNNAVKTAIDSKQDIANLSQTLDTSTTKYLSNNAVKTAIDAKESLPPQAGNSGKFLTTNGTTASWGNALFAPKPTTSTGVGQWTSVAMTKSGAQVYGWYLPSGGTWAYYHGGFYSSSNGDSLVGISGIAAGGSLITTTRNITRENYPKLLCYRIA